MSSGHEPGPSSPRPAKVGAPTRWSLAVFGGALTVYLLTATRSGLTSSDVYASSVQAWGLGTTGRPWLELAGDPEGVRFALAELDGIRWLNGHIVSTNTVGSWLFAAPFYAAFGDASQFSLAGGAIAASVIGALAVLWMYLALYRSVPPGFALAGAAVFAFALPTWSVSADGTWTHTVTQCAVAGAAIASAKGRWWLAGLALGIGSFARAHLLVIAAVLGLGMSSSMRSIRPVLQVGLASTGSLAVLVGINYLVYGTPSIGGGRSDPLTRLDAGLDGRGINYLENMAGFFTSPGRGVLVFTPVLLVLLPAVVRAWHSAPDWTRWLATGGLTYTALQLWIAHFFGGDAYSAYRLGLELVTCLVPVYTYAASTAGTRARAVTAFLVTLQVGVTGLGAWVRPWIAEGTEWTDNEMFALWRAQPTASTVLAVAIVALALLAAKVTYAYTDQSNSSPVGDASRGRHGATSDTSSDPKRSQ